MITHYDELNRLKTVTIDWLPSRPVATYYYDDAGRLTSLTNFNGTVTTYGYDNANRLTSLMNKKSDATTLASYSFTLDGNGNRTQTIQNEPLTFTLSPNTVSYTYNDPKRNRLMTAGTFSFTYDNEGQLQTGYSASYTFDYEHRLKTIGGTTQFYYDGAGNRVQAVRSGVTTRYIYDARGNLLAEADGNNNITKYYIYGAGLIAMVTPANQTYCYHFNAVGSTVAMTDSTQTIINKYVYDQFGNVVNQVEAVAQSFKFVGQHGVMTEPNGFYYMRARYYDPSVGRFASEDPIGFEGGDMNLMAYVGNNPVNRFDPSGLTWGSNLTFFLDWVSGGGSNNRFYGSNTVETKEMQNSPGANALRNDFYAGGGNNFVYGTGQAAWDTVLNPATADWSSTAAQVGGFAGASAINNGNGTVTFTITNVAGANSFFYHLVPDISGTTGAMRNIKQIFQWTEAIQCK